MPYEMFRFYKMNGKIGSENLLHSFTLKQYQVIKKYINRKYKFRKSRHNMSKKYGVAIRNETAKAIRAEKIFHPDCFL